MEPDYKKLYEDAVEMAKALQEDWKSTGNRAWKEIANVFPQLGKSNNCDVIAYLKRCAENDVTSPNLWKIDPVGYSVAKRAVEYLNNLDSCLRWTDEDEEMWSNMIEMLQNSRRACKTIVDPEVMEAFTKKISWLNNWRNKIYKLRTNE